MTVVHCLQHSDRVVADEVAVWADERGVELRTTRVDLEPLPSPDDVDRLVVLGGAMNTDEAHLHPWLDDERVLLSAVIARPRSRALGICLGSQLLAEVLGGSCGRAARREVGWHRLELTAAGRRSPVFGTLPEGLEVFQWHGDSWRLPPGAELVASGVEGACQTQAFSWEDRVHGVQFHPEFSYERTTRLARSTSDDLSTGGLVQRPEQFLARPERFAAANAWLRELLDAALLAPLPVDGD